MRDPSPNPIYDRRAFLRVAAGTIALAGISPWRSTSAVAEEPSVAAVGISLLVGHVTDRSAVVNLLSDSAQTVTVQCRGPGVSIDRAIVLKPGLPGECTFERLNPDTRYDLVVAAGSATARGRIQTQRSVGRSFVFTVQGDSHPERPQMFDSSLYRRTLDRVAADQPDFHICMGDDFSIAKIRDITEASVASRYLLQRSYLQAVGAPLFLVNGNHEQASLFNYNQKGVPHDAAVWAQQARNRLFPLPSPGAFYTGNTQPLDPIGLLRDYHAWTWGDALFVILDNYWHAPACVDTSFGEDDARDRRKGKDRDWWNITLGDTQYQWFARTLESSRAKYKFVFAHHVMGTGRGGIEQAPFYEWGGKAGRDRGTFAAHRPTWKHPIHDLMSRHGVSIFFQGHDHLYARQELDGVVYQTCPLPADASYAIYNDNRYTSGIKHANSGYLRVSVGPGDARVEYVRTYNGVDQNADRKHGAIAHAYAVKPRLTS